MLAFRCAVRVHTKGHFNSKSQLPHAVSAAPLGGRQLTRTMVSNGSNAFIDPNLHVKATGQGALTGLTFAAKDLFDIKGQVTGYGQPTWHATHKPATQTSPAVQALLDAGADLTGKTHLDELAYSLNGENYHYGTPVNPACPARIPGGSSSGSAVAVADGSVDSALGSDTGGSIRVPASYCGLLGIRPTHGRVSLQHACTLAASFDTGGWFARDADVFQKLGSVLLEPEGRADTPLRRWLIAADAFDHAEPTTSQAIYQLIQGHLEEVKGLLGDPQEVTVSSLGGSGPLTEWGTKVFRITQGAEIWEELGEWITANKPDFGPGTKERFEMCSRLTPQEVEEAREQRKRIAADVQGLLGNDGVMMLPTAPGPAPLLKMPADQLNVYRSRLLSLTSIAGLSSLPQVTLPVVTVDGCPVGLSMVGPRGSDEQLLALTAKLMPMLAPKIQ